MMCYITIRNNGELFDKCNGGLYNKSVRRGPGTLPPGVALSATLDPSSTSGGNRVWDPSDRL